MKAALKNLVELSESKTASSEDFAHFPLPDTMSAMTVHRDETEIFHGLAFHEKDPRRSLHYEEVPLPEVGPNEVLVAVMASALNFNNVWSSLFEPSPGFNYIGEYSRYSPVNAKHNLDYHILGTDGAGVVVRTGSAVTRWKPGDRVMIFGPTCDVSSPEVFDDEIRDPHLMAYGFETNFGSFADFTLVREHQLLPKPEHLTWVEAASMTLVATTTYRMLVSRNGAQMSQGDNVLIWGASGGLGTFAIQFVLNGGGIPVGVVSSEEKAAMVRKMGCERVIVLPRSEGEDRFLDGNGHTKNRQILRLKAQIRKLTGGEDPDIVFEHTGRSTFAASVAVARPGGKIVTCGSTSGYDHVFDNRYLWQTVKHIIGSHAANYYEAVQTARLIGKGFLYPTLSRVFPLAEGAEAFSMLHKGTHMGKLGFLNIAPEENMGIRDYELREKVGEEKIRLFRCDDGACPAERCAVA